MELTTTANKLLELLYLQSLDEASINALDLPDKNEALKQLIDYGFVYEDEIFFPEETYIYYDLTPEGERAFETGDITLSKGTPAVRILIVVGSMAALLALIIIFMENRAK